MRDLLLEEYMLTNNIWSLELGNYWKWRESLLCNSLDKHAVSFVKHIPYNMTPVILSFLARDCNKHACTCSVKIIEKRAHELWVYRRKKYLEHLHCRRHGLQTSQSISGARVMTVSLYTVYSCMLCTVYIKEVIMHYDIQ